MAFWKRKMTEFEETNRIVQRNPGISQAELARALDVPRSTISRRLPSMDEAGYLYSEDERGRLWPFDKRR